jgi:hypothetical protein
MKSKNPPNVLGNETVQQIRHRARPDAYEAVLAEKHGRRTLASRTWQMIQRHGIVSAVERALERETIGYTALVELGLERYAFEALVLRHPDSFSKDTVEQCRERAAQWTAK